MKRNEKSKKKEEKIPLQLQKYSPKRSHLEKCLKNEALTSKFVMKKKKLLFVVSNLGIGGGAEKSVALVAKGLKDFYDVEILTFYDFKEEYKCPVKRHSLGFNYSNSLVKKGFRLLFYFPYLVSGFLKRNKYDVVISNAEDANVTCLVSKKVFFDFNLWTVIRNDVFDKSHPYRRVNFLQKYADKRIVLTNELKKRCPYKSVVLRNAIDFDDVQRKKKEKIPEDERRLFEKKTIVMVGRLARQKNHAWFFDVFERLNRADVNLLIIGTGPMEKKLKEKVKDLNNVYFLGRKENVYKYLDKANVFVLPSLFEGMPRALMEALAVGCVSVANDCKTGVRELLDVPLDKRLKDYEKTKYGYLVPFNNKKKFIKALNDALDNGKRIKPDKRFSLEKVTKEWREEIERG